MTPLIESNIDPKLHDEPARLAALQRYDVLDTPKEAPFERITALVKAVLNVPICAVSLIDSDRQWFKSCIGVDAPETTRDISFCTHTIQQREPMQIPDALLDPRFQNNPLVTGGPAIRSYLGIPLSTPDGYNIGSLCAIDTVPRTYTADQIAVLKSFAALVIDELELRRLAHTDHLTGVNTRRSFCLEMERALAMKERAGTPSSIVVMDIDFFKRINDTYGHPAGDLVLQSVASCLSAELRPDDHLGRLGGEEFGILLRGVDLRQAVLIAERFRAAVEDLRIVHDPVLQITASFGVASIDEPGLSTQKWLAEADEALYQAKRTGRNRCCQASSTLELV